MTTSKVRRASAAALCVACVVLLVIGGINLPKKEKPAGQDILNDLRTQSILNATGEGVVESYVNIAKKQAQEKQLREEMKAAAIAAEKAERRERLGVQEVEVPASQVGNRRYARGRAYDPDRFKVEE